MAAHGLTQLELAERMGINRVSVNRLLSDRNDLKISTITKIAEAIGCDVAEFFAPEEDVPEQPRTVCPHCGKSINITVS